MTVLIEVKNAHNWVHYINPDYVVDVRDERPLFENVIIVMSLPVYQGGETPDTNSCFINVRPDEWDRVKPLLVKPLPRNDRDSGRYYVPGDNGVTAFQFHRTFEDR